MKRSTYMFGSPGVTWGIWNTERREFQFGICEDSPMLAEARLFYKIGEDARKYKFVVKAIPNRREQ